MIPSVSARRRNGVERLLVGRRHVLRATGIAEERVLRADAGVVEPRGDRMRVLDLAVGVGEQGRARAVQDSRAAGDEARRSRRLHADEPHVGVVDEAGEQADRVRAAADAGNDCVRQPSLGGEKLLARLVPDHCLQLPDDRPDTGAGRRTSRSGSGSSARS